MSMSPIIPVRVCWGLWQGFCVAWLLNGRETNPLPVIGIAMATTGSGPCPDKYRIPKGGSPQNTTQR